MTPFLSAIMTDSNYGCGFGAALMRGLRIYVLIPGTRILPAESSGPFPAKARSIGRIESVPQNFETCWIPAPLDGSCRALEWQSAARRPAF
jgi:hypothetical protein